MLAISGMLRVLFGGRALEAFNAAKQDNNHLGADDTERQVEVSAASSPLLAGVCRAQPWSRAAVRSGQQAAA